MEEVRIWIDADSCPVKVRNHTVRTAARLGIKVYFVANKTIPCNESPYEMIICPQEKDAADNCILQRAGRSDLVITRDIVFADRLVERGIAAINDRGTAFTAENIKELLSDRNFDLALAEAGVSKPLSYGYDKKDFAKFADCFDKIIHRLLAQAAENQQK